MCEQYDRGRELRHRLNKERDLVRARANGMANHFRFTIRREGETHSRELRSILPSFGPFLFLRYSLVIV
jgi:hypothetical protein